jgi:Mycothiol maleylpyruvate isomerase N-terminal domain
VQTTRETVSLLQRQRHQVTALVDRLPSNALSRPGLGGGMWAPKDLIGHLESWEEHALGALDAWSRGEVAPIDRDIRAFGLNAVNAREVERKSGRTGRRARASADATFAKLIEQIRAVPKERWLAPPTSRARRSLGSSVGRILGGPKGLFTHDQAHLPDLRAFVAEHGG